MNGRRDIERDDAGNEFYSPRTSDYINERAEALGLTFAQAAALYECGSLELEAA